MTKCAGMQERMKTGERKKEDLTVTNFIKVMQIYEGIAVFFIFH